MRFSLWPSMHWPFEEFLAVARHAEATGWDGLWFTDHLAPDIALGEKVEWDIKGPPRTVPLLECWTMLSAVAATVPRITLGTMVCANTFRHPAVVAKMATVADHISGGRLILGMGGGWQESEHHSYGIPYYTTGERLRRLDEACTVIRSLLDLERTNFSGKYYELAEAPLEPKPLQQHLPILVGGRGKRVTLRIVARHADQWNAWASSDGVRRLGAVLDQHCTDVDRDPRSIHRTAQSMVYLADKGALKTHQPTDTGVPTISGSIDIVRHAISDYCDAGLDEFVFPGESLPGPLEAKLEILDLFIGQVAAEFR